jgi:CYTH domain-containing protein
MAVERRFLIASSLARLIQKDRGSGDRVVEAHFPARSDRRQLVRVEQGQSHLILRSRAEDGQIRDEQVQVPLSLAEALVEVAAGTVVFDRWPLFLGSDVEAVLDRFIMPSGLDLLTITTSSDMHGFVPLPWFGPEVTGAAAYGNSDLALNGMPFGEEVEVSNAVVEALLDTLEGRRAYLHR